MQLKGATEASQLNLVLLPSPPPVMTRPRDVPHLKTNEQIGQVKSG